MRVQEIRTVRQALEMAGSSERLWIEKLLCRFPPDQRKYLTGCGKCAGEILLNMQDPATRVYLLVKGEVNGISAQSSGVIYRFAHFSAPFLLGEFEAFSGAEIYRSTLVCASDCVFLWMPRESYLSWMKQDPKTLFWRTCEITASLSEQARNERERLFCSGKQKLAIYLAACCQKERCGPQGYLLRQTIQNMADGIGSSTKTVQRALSQLIGEGAVQREGHQLRVSRSQYDRLLLLAEPEGEADEI